MRVIFSYEYPFHRQGYGGGQQIARGFAREFAARGHEVYLVCTGHDEMGVRAADIGVQYVFGRARGRWSAVATARSVLHLLRVAKPEHVCSFTSEGVILGPICRLLRIPFMVYLAAPDLPRFSWWCTRGRHCIRYHVPLYMQYLASHFAQRVAAISAHSVAQAEENWNVPRARLAHVGAGIEDVFCCPGVSGQVAVVARGLRVLSIGRIALAQKPLDLVAAALRDLGAAWEQWTIVGSGPDEERLRVVLHDYGVLERTVFMGTRTSAEIAKLLLQHHLVVLPSRFESLMLTVYEAAAMGRMIVTNDVADIRSYFGVDGLVVLASEASSGAYCAAIQEAIARHRQRAARSGEDTQRVHRDCRWSAVAERLLAAMV